MKISTLHMKKLLDRVNQDVSYDLSIDRIIQLFHDNDPSLDKKYTRWMIYSYIKGGIENIENLSRVSHALAVFDNNKNKLNIKNIYDVNSLVDLERILGNLLYSNNELSNTQIVKIIKSKETEYWYRGDDGIILVPLTNRSSYFWGRGTKWCTATADNNDDYQYYTNGGHENLFVVIDRKNNKKYQLNFEIDEYQDEMNNEINLGVFSKERPWLFQSLFPYINRIPNLALKLTIEVINGPFPLFEYGISRQANCAYTYALSVIQGRFESGEKVISTDAKYAYLYAYRVLRGRFLMGEMAISKSALNSYLYATNVLKGRFILGENSIAENKELWRRYTKFLRKKNIEFC